MSTRYTAIVDGKHGEWGVVFPDCPGAAAMGETIDEALKNAALALQDWISEVKSADNTIPAASSVEHLLKNSDVIDSLKDGGFIASVPLLPNTGKSVRVNLSLDKAFVNWVDDEAKRQGLTRSAYFERAAREYAIRS